MYQTVIWDWNGTLLCDAALCRNVMNHLLTERHLQGMTKKRYEALFDFPVTDYYQKLGFDFTRESFESLGNAFMAGYELQRHRCSLQPGARAILQSLHERGTRQGILSAYRQDSLQSLLESKGLSRFFTWIVGAPDHYARGKVEQARSMISRIATTPRHVILIGDTLHDVEVARAMGVDCALVYGGHQSMERLTGAGCSVFKNLHELNVWLLETT